MKKEHQQRIRQARNGGKTATKQHNHSGKASARKEAPTKHPSK
jgi:hypothetical protein